VDRAKGIRGFFDSLSQPPDRPWPEGVQHHGARILLLVLLSILTGFLFPVASLPDLPAVEPGEVLEDDIIAEESFQLPRPLADLQRERDQAAASVPTIFRYDGSALDSMRERIGGMLDRVDSAYDETFGETESAERLRVVLAPYSLPSTTAEVELLRPPEHRTALRRSLMATIDNDMARGVASVSDIANNMTRMIRVIREDSDRQVSRDSIVTGDQVRDAAARHVPTRMPAGLVEFQRLILLRMMVPTLERDGEATELARQTARDAVPTIEDQIYAGERVIAAHERIDEEDIRRLDAYVAHMADLGLIQAGPRRYLRIAGGVLLNALLLTVFGMMLRLYRQQIYTSFRSVLLVCFLYLSVIVPAAVIAGSTSPSALIPIAFPALVAAVLWDGRVALSLALVLAILLSVQGNLGETSARILLASGGAAAALSVRVVHRRAHGLILGAVVAVAYFVASLAMALMLSWDVATFATTVAWGTANGIGCALIAVGLMPVFEAWTGITTDQTLLELGDLNGPLLKRLSLEASGTYAHSVNAAHLAEAAARAIGANPLLARVGAYYHDIGKMAAPQYFVENQASGRNPHDRLAPEDSVAIIRGHVLEGMRMAEQAKLPDCVRQFIPEHHGTQLIGFFFEKAKASADGRALDPDDYSYPGPNPRSRETAILMLADSVESAAKVLEEPTPEGIRTMVDRIIQGKINRGQMDEAPLTFADLARVRDAFVTVLSGMYHHRIDYPASAIGLTSPVPEPVRRDV
jgi:hypothetical protein